MNGPEPMIGEPQQAAIAERDLITGELSTAGRLPYLTAKPEAWASFDPKNYIAIMVSICNTFGLNHQQMMYLRTRVEKAFHAQPQVFSVRAPAPVTLNGVAITYGLLIGFGGYKDALKASADRVVKLAREYDPFKDVDSQLQKQMHKRAQANRRTMR